MSVELDKIRTMYLSGMTDKAIAKIFGVCLSTINNYRKRHGVLTRPFGGWRKGTKNPKHSKFMKKYHQSHKSPMLGRKHSTATKKRMSKSWSYEKIMTPERNAKVSEARKKKYGTKNTNKRYLKSLIRKSAIYKNWRKRVFERDNFTCQQCSKISKKGKSLYIEAHHIKSFEHYPDLRFSVENGLTLCRKCHLKIA